MTTAVTPTASSEQQPVEKERNTGKVVAFILSFVALGVVLMLPIPGLAMPAKIALGMLAFAVIMWLSLIHI